MDEKHETRNITETPRRKAPRPDLEVFDDGYTKVPAFWIDELMPHANGIPASFWKFLLVLWRDIVGIKGTQRGYIAEKSMTQFHCTKDTAMRWTAALAVSGLFRVDYGVRHAANEPGIPTKFKYLDGSIEDWVCFIVALRKTVLDDRREHDKETGDGIRGFRVSVAVAVDEERLQRGLSRCNAEWLADCVKDGTVRRGADGFYRWLRKPAKHNFQPDEFGSPEASGCPPGLFADKATSSFDLLPHLGDWVPGKPDVN